jgi:hypothetical protein
MLCTIHLHQGNIGMLLQTTPAVNVFPWQRLLDHLQVDWRMASMLPGHSQRLQPRWRQIRSAASVARREWLPRAADIIITAQLDFDDRLIIDVARHARHLIGVSIGNGKGGGHWARLRQTKELPHRQPLLTGYAVVQGQYPAPSGPVRVLRQPRGYFLWVIGKGALHRAAASSCQHGAPGSTR